MIFAVGPGESGAAFVEHPRQERITAEARTRAAWRTLGKVSSAERFQARCHTPGSVLCISGCTCGTVCSLSGIGGRAHNVSGLCFSMFDKEFRCGSLAW